MAIKSRSVRRARSTPGFSAPNVVSFRLGLLSRHISYLNRWLAAGRCMGLCDASGFEAGTDGVATDFVLVWVREAADPAYMITAEGTRWVVRDQVRKHVLARVSTFESALHLIRPVLPIGLPADNEAAAIPCVRRP